MYTTLRKTVFSNCGQLLVTTGFARLVNLSIKAMFPFFRYFVANLSFIFIISMKMIFSLAIVFTLT